MAKETNRRARLDQLGRVSVPDVPIQYHGLVMDVGNKLAGANAKTVAERIGKVLRGEIELLIPSGARIHILEVPVCSSDWKKKTIEKIILLNYLDGSGGWDDAITWAQGRGFEEVGFREVCAIGMHKPNLYQELGMDCPMYVGATRIYGVNRGVPERWHYMWFGPESGINIGYAYGHGGMDHWYAFRWPKPKK